jgi:hypothetical protein
VSIHLWQWKPRPRVYRWRLHYNGRKGYLNALICTKTALDGSLLSFPHTTRPILLEAGPGQKRSVNFPSSSCLSHMLMAFEPWNGAGYPTFNQRSSMSMQHWPHMLQCTLASARHQNVRSYCAWPATAALRQSRQCPGSPIFRRSVAE